MTLNFKLAEIRKGLLSYVPTGFNEALSWSKSVNCYKNDVHTVKVKKKKNPIKKSNIHKFK